MLQDAIRASPLFVALPRSPHRSLLVWQHDPWASPHCNQHPPQAKRHQQRTGAVSKYHSKCCAMLATRDRACLPARGLVALPACDGQEKRVAKASHKAQWCCYNEVPRSATCTTHNKVPQESCAIPRLRTPPPSSSSLAARAGKSSCLLASLDLSISGSVASALAAPFTAGAWDTLPTTAAGLVLCDTWVRGSGVRGLAGSVGHHEAAGRTSNRRARC